MPKLEVYRGRQHLFDHWIKRPAIVIGRSPEVEVPLDSPAASRRHCRIYSEGLRYFVEDLGGRNGVFVNGQKIDRARLRNGDSIEIADHILLFQRSKQEIAAARAKAQGHGEYRIDTATLGEALTDGSSSFATRASARDMSAKSTTMVSPEELEKMMAELKKKQQAHLEVLGDNEHIRVPLDGARWTVGFSEDCDIELPWGWIWPWGRRAARLHNLGKGAFEIERLSWWCAVRIDDDPLKVGEAQALDGGEVIRIGPGKARFHAATKIAAVEKKREKRRRRR